MLFPLMKMRFDKMYTATLSRLARVCFGILLILATASSAHAQSGLVEGHVVERGANTPVPGVNVVLQGTGLQRGTTTDAEGRYRFEDVPAGTYQLEATAIGYAAHRESVQVPGDGVVTVDIQLTSRAYELDEVVVSATRREEELSAVPSSVSVLGPEELDHQSAITSDLGDVLAQTTPGLAPTTHSFSNYGQTLRGRDLFVLIDGVPQSAPLRNVSRSLRSIDASAIERIEVVRGANALYGYGASGGIINIITRRPTTTEPTFRTEVGSRFSPAEIDDSFGGRLAQQAWGRAGRIDYLVSGSYESWGHFFDGEGDRVPQDPQGQGGLAGADEYNVLTRVGTQLGEQQRLDLAINYYDFKQGLEFATVSGTPGQDKATAEETDEFPGKDPGTENLTASLHYTNGDVAGSRLSVRLYVQDFMTRFGYYSGFPDGGGQSLLDTEKVGARVDLTTPLPLTAGSTLLWGVDALRDQTGQPLEDGRTYVPPITQLSAAPFVQAKLPFGDRALLRAGARYEAFQLSVDDYTTLFEENRVEGGTLTYDALVFNVGGVVTLVEGIDLFGGFSQGFSVADVGRTLRGTVAPSVEALHPEAQTVNSYELGVRGGNALLSGSVAGFINTSDLGTTFGDFPELEILRSPERIRGIEASLDVQPIATVQVGGTLSYLEGKRDSDEDGDYDAYLTGDRIPPSKLTGYVAYKPAAGWETRLQVMHSGARDRFDGAAEAEYARGDVEPYAVFDLYSAVDVGPGTIRLGVENLFDTFYFPSISQWYNLGTGYAAAPGRQVSLTYAVTW